MKRFWGCGALGRCLHCPLAEVSREGGQPPHAAVQPRHPIDGALSRAAGPAAQQPAVAEPGAGKHRVVKCQHQTRESLFTQARSQGIDAAVHAFCFSLSKCCGWMISKLLFWVFFYYSVQGNGCHWNWRLEWLRVCSNAGTFCYCCFQNELYPRSALQLSQWKAKK